MIKSWSRIEKFFFGLALTLVVLSAFLYCQVDQITYFVLNDKTYINGEDKLLEPISDVMNDYNNSMSYLTKHATLLTEVVYRVVFAFALGGYIILNIIFSSCTTSTTALKLVISNFLLLVSCSLAFVLAARKSALHTEGDGTSLVASTSLLFAFALTSIVCCNLAYWNAFATPSNTYTKYMITVSSIVALLCTLMRLVCVDCSIYMPDDHSLIVGDDIIAAVNSELLEAMVWTAMTIFSLFEWRKAYHSRFPCKSQYYGKIFTIMFGIGGFLVYLNLLWITEIVILRYWFLRDFTRIVPEHSKGISLSIEFLVMQQEPSLTTIVLALSIVALCTILSLRVLLCSIVKLPIHENASRQSATQHGDLGTVQRTKNCSQPPHQKNGTLWLEFLSLMGIYLLIGLWGSIGTGTLTKNIDKRVSLDAVRVCHADIWWEYFYTIRRIGETNVSIDKVHDAEKSDLFVRSLTVQMLWLSMRDLATHPITDSNLLRIFGEILRAGVCTILLLYSILSSCALHGSYLYGTLTGFPVPRIKYIKRYSLSEYSYWSLPPLIFLLLAFPGYCPFGSTSVLDVVRIRLIAFFSAGMMWRNPPLPSTIKKKK